jgi:P4 family phage/plasmid primase-like protien
MSYKLKFNEIVNDFIQQLLSRFTFWTYRDTGKIFVYNQEEGVYEPAESRIVYECCQSEIVNTPSAKSIIEMNIKGNSYHDRNTYNDAVCVKNGILCFQHRDIKFIPHTSKICFESKLQIAYNPKLKCSKWVEVLDYILPKKEDRDLLQEWIGYHFVKGQPLEKAMFFTGKRSTGKSTVIWVIDTLMGNCCSHAELSSLQQDKDYCRANLYNKLANTYTDMGNATITDSGIFKVLTGSKDTITCRMPYEKPFNFINSAKFTFASNKLPPLSAGVQGDLAFWKRILLIQFVVTINSPDTGIFNKLEKEMTGILNWALDGYLRLKSNNGQFTKNCDDVYSTWTQSAYSLNPLDEFIETVCILNPTAFIQSIVLRGLYEFWCNKNNEIPINSQEFRACLAQKGIFESSKLNKETGKRELTVKGICQA